MGHFGTLQAILAAVLILAFVQLTSADAPFDFSQISVGPLKDSGTYVPAEDWPEIDEDRVETLLKEINRVPIDAFVEKLGNLKTVAVDGVLNSDRIRYQTRDGEKRTLYCAAIRVNAPLGKILQSMHRIDHFRKSRPDFMELHIRPNSYMFGFDKHANLSWWFEFEFTRSNIPNVGARSARIKSVFHMTGNSVRVDSHLVLFGEAAPATTLERFDTAALILPIDKTQAETTHLVLLAQDVDPGKPGENIPLFAGKAKQKEVNVDLMHIKKQSEQEHRDD